MDAFLDWFNYAGQGDALLRAALARLWFETIHPFEDGNGRRLYGLSRHFCEHRSSYYEALGRAQGPSMRAWLAAHRTGWLAK